MNSSTAPRRARRRAAGQSGSSEYPIYPYLGIVVTVMATVLAIVAVPGDPAPKTAMVFPGWIMAVGLALVPAAAALRGLKTLLRGEHLLVLAPIYWLLLDLIQAAYQMDGIDARSAKLALVGIGLFASGVWIAALMRPWPMPDVLLRTAMFEMPPGAIFTIALLSFALGIFKYAQPCGFDPSQMIYFLGKGRFDAPWNRGMMGGWDAFRDVMQYFGYLLPALAVLLANRIGWLNLRTGVVIILALIMTLFIAQEGGRRNVGVIIGMAIILWVVSQRRLGIKGVLAVALSGGLLLYALQTMLYYRGVGLGAAFNPEVEIQERGFVHVDDNFYRLCQTIQLVPAQYPHTYHKYFIYILVRPIPRVFWPGKPVDGGFDLAASVDVVGASLSNSVVGELYVAGGFIVIFIGGWLYGRFAGMALPLLAMRQRMGAIIIYCAWTMALFAGFRSMLDLVLISYVILAWIALAWVYQFFGGGTVARTASPRRPKGVT